LRRGERARLAGALVVAIGCGIIALAGGSRAGAVAPLARMTYHGGPTIDHVKIVGVQWGAGVMLNQVVAAKPPNVKSFASNLVQSPFLDLLSEYSANSVTPENIHRGSYDSTAPANGLHTMAPAPANDASGACTTEAIDDATNIQPELRAQIGAHAIPSPDPDTLYVLFFHEGQCITLGGPAGQNSRDNFCAYHTRMEYPTGRVHYIVMPYDAFDLGCGTDYGFGNVTSVLSHEIAEAITDPDIGGSGWKDLAPGKGEIGDICNHVNARVVLAGRSYTAQNVWSELQQRCTVSGPARFVSVGDATIVEGDTGTRIALVPITLATPSAFKSLSLAVTVGNGPTQHVTWTKSVATKFVAVPVPGNTVVDGNRTMPVRIVANDGYGVIRSQGAVMVLDDDPGAGERMAIGDAAAVVAGAADSHLYVPVTLATPAPAAISATYTVSAGSAATRFTLAKRGTVRFAKGTTTAFLDATVRCPATPPTVNTSFTVTLSAPVGAVLARATGTGTLLAP
jgi:hypothetical protein